MNVATKVRPRAAARPASRQRLRLWRRLLHATRAIEAELRERRSFLVRLTPRGQAQFATLARAHEQWIDKMLSEFDGAEAEAIIQHLDGLAGRVRNGGARP